MPPLPPFPPAPPAPPVPALTTCFTWRFIILGDDPASAIYDVTNSNTTAITE